MDSVGADCRSTVDNFVTLETSFRDAFVGHHRIERHLDELGFHTHVIALYKVMKTPPWKLIIPSICFELCKYKKSDTDPVLYGYYYSDLLNYFTGGSKDGFFFSCRYITLLSSTASHISAQCHCISAGHQLYTLVAGVGSLASVPLSVVPLYNRMWCHHHSTPICSYCICIFQLSFSVC